MANGKGQGGPGQPGGPQVELVVIVNGDPKPLTVNEHQPLRSIVGRALNDEGGEVPKEWYFTNENGDELDLEKSIGDFHFATGTKIFLNKRAGPLGGGASAVSL